MSKLFINYKYYPECGGRIKGYYYYCGRCGNQDVVSWKYSGILVLIAGIIFLIVMYFAAKSFCENKFFFQVELCKYFRN